MRGAPLSAYVCEIEAYIVLLPQVIVRICVLSIGIEYLQEDLISEVSVKLGSTPSRCPDKCVDCGNGKTSTTRTVTVAHQCPGAVMLVCWMLDAN
jgi:hypothetical protein